MSTDECEGQRIHKGQLGSPLEASPRAKVVPSIQVRTHNNAGVNSGHVGGMEIAAVKETALVRQDSLSNIHAAPMVYEPPCIGSRIRPEPRSRAFSPTFSAKCDGEECKEGQMWRQSSGFLKSWKRKYCRLKKHVFAYYKNKGDIKVQGVLNFDMLTCAINTVADGETQSQFMYCTQYHIG